MYLLCDGYRDPNIVIDPRNHPPPPKREIYFEYDSERIDRQSLPYLIENITKTDGEDRFFRGIMFTSFCALEMLYGRRMKNDDIDTVITEYFNEHGLYNNFPYPLKKEIQKILLNRFPEVVCRDEGEESCCTLR